MKSTLLSLVISIISLFSYGQKNPSKASIEELSKAIEIQYYYGNTNFRATMNYFFRREGISSAYGVLKIENMGKNNTDRDFIFKILYEISNSKDELSSNFIYWQMKASTAIEISEFIYQKFDQHYSKLIEKESSYTGDERSKKFFQGIKLFCDSSHMYIYQVRIEGTNVMIALHPSEINQEEANTFRAISSDDYYIKGENLVDKNGKKANVTLDNNKLYVKTSKGLKVYNLCSE